MRQAWTTSKSSFEKEDTYPIPILSHSGLVFLPLRGGKKTPSNGCNLGFLPPFPPATREPLLCELWLPNGRDWGTRTTRRRNGSVVYLPNLVPNEVAGRALSGTRLWKKKGGGGKGSKVSVSIELKNKKERSKRCVIVPLFCRIYSDTSAVTIPTAYIVPSLANYLHPQSRLMSYVGAAVL